ncbi:MAG: RNA-dependent RNA polymerase [Ixodes ricinus bunyavirus-like virus 1]|nr:MAG: RNA-dependent RNA polymerase [Ixodes ricinus bunyavirus-like virus 1]
MSDEWSSQVRHDLENEPIHQEPLNATFPDLGALNLFQSTLESFQSSVKKVKSGIKVSAEELKRQVESIRGSRHELYASLFQSENDLEQESTDENHLEKVYAELERLQVDQLVIEALRNKEGSRQYHDVKRFTPDGVFVELDERNDPVVTIIDYTVTVKPKEMTEEKLEKYKPLLSYYSDFSPNLTVASMSPTTGNQYMAQEGTPRTWREPRLSSNMKKLFKRSVELVQDLTSSLPLEERDIMIEFINSQMKSTEKGEVDVTFPFGMSVAEFLENMDKRVGFKWHLDSLSDYERDMFLSALIHESRGDSGKKELAENSEAMIPGAKLLDLSEFEMRLDAEKERIMEEAKAYKSDEPPVEPTKEVIMESLQRHDSMVKERFEIITESKLVHHIPFHFRSKPDSEERKHALSKLAKIYVTERQVKTEREKTELEEDLFPELDEEGNEVKATDLEVQTRAENRFKELCEDLEVNTGEEEAKKSRYRAALRALDQVMNPNSDVEMLKDLFAMGDLKGEDFVNFKEGKVKMARDHRAKEYKLTNVVRRPSSVIKGGGPKPEHGQLDNDEVAFYDWLKTKDCHSISLKKGEVIVVKPSNTAQIKLFEEKAGVGKKNKKRNGKRTVGKTVSLDISNAEVRQKISLEFLGHSHGLAEVCTKVGDQIPTGSEEILLKAKLKNDKSFKEMSNPEPESQRQEDKSDTSSAESSIHSEHERVYIIPRTVPPKPGLCKEALQHLGEDPIKGYTGEVRDRNLWKGLCHMGRTHQLFYENLSFVSQMASSGYRIVGSNNPGQFLITFPTDSIMKGQSTIPFVVMTIVLPGDSYSNQVDKNEQVFKLKCGGEIRLTMGRRVNRGQLSGYLSAYPRFMIAAEIMENLREESAIGPMTPMDLMNLYLFVNCININSSSLLDNMRYMVEVCMGQYSYVNKYIEDKLMVPAKTELHMFMYNRMRELLANINQSMDTVRMKVPTLDAEGTVDVSTLRIVDGSFESYLFSGYYRKPDHLLMELITLFFCTSKGLHGTHHNMVDIHNTPLSIQEPLNLLKPRDFVRHPVEKRHQYSPEVVRAAVRAAEMSTGTTVSQIRQRFARQENPGGHPASVPTLSSTSSTLVEAEEGMNIPEDVDLTEAELKVKNPALYAQALNELHSFEERLPAIRGESNKRRQWQKIKKRINKILGMKEREKDPLTSSLYLEPRSGMLLRKTQSNKQKIRQSLKGMLDNEWRKEKLSSGSGLPRGDFATKWRERFRFYDSGVVFTEVLRYSEERLKQLKNTTISGMAKSHAKKVGDMRVAIRPKGQRTQKDREIFVIDLMTKVAIYLLEHMYKQICSTISAEKISVPGDAKIIDMYGQTKAEITWCKRTMESFARIREEMGEEAAKVPNNVYCLHHNIDMTKWAPKDNLQKFNWVIAMSRILTLEEKLYYMSVLDIMWNKKIYLDDDIMLESMKSTLSGDFDPEGCIFYRMTEGYKSNLVPVKQTWLQGQLNYLSSFVHVGAMKLYEEIMQETFPDGNCIVNINVHSDDNETTLCCATDMTLEEVSMKSWNSIEYFCRNVCIELSKKKSSISMQCKQFISIYNIGGEQIHPWVKSAMAVVSGLPYLTISDDMSSALSKIAEAGSKGAPKKVLTMCLEITRIHVLDVHGVLDRKTGENRFAREMGIEESMMPMMLGGCHVREWSPFIVCGPKYVDKGNLMHLLRKLTSARSNIEPQGLHKVMKEEDVSEGTERSEASKAFRALKLYLLSDMMCYDQVDDEEQSSACKGMNFFRPCKFKNRRFGLRTPFEGVTKEELDQLSNTYKMENPCIMLKKPNNQEDLRKYCLCQFNDPKFQDSLAGQSPNMLLLRHIQSRNKPRFRLLCTGSMNDKGEQKCIEMVGSGDEIEDKVLAGCPLTLEETIALLKKRMEKIKPNLNDCKMLWRRYIANDPEYKAVQFAIDNCTTTTAYRKLNLVPSKKPNFSQYSEVVNTLPDLIVFFCDQEFSNRNGFGLHFPRSAPKDWTEMEKMFPRETACLRWRATKHPGKMKNLIETISKLEEVEITESMNEHISRGIAAIKQGREGESVKKARIEALRRNYLEIAQKLIKWKPVILSKDEWKEGELVQVLKERRLDIPKWMMFSEKEVEHLRKVEESLPRELVRMARTFKSITSRVLFTPPVHTDDILETTLQLRSAIESAGSYQLRMFLSSNLKSSKTIQMLTDNPDTVHWHYKACDTVSFLYETCRVLGANENQIKSILDDTLFSSKPIMEYRAKFPKLTPEYQNRSIVPLYVHKPSYARLMIESMGPYLKDWKVAQDHYGKGEFVCEVKGNGFKITVQGVDTRMDKIDIVHTRDLNLGTVNMVFSELARDIKHMGQKKKTRVNLHQILRHRVMEEGEKHPFLLDASRNRIAFWQPKTNYMVIIGLTVKKIPGEMQREIVVRGLTSTMHGLVCSDGTVTATIKHRPSKNPECDLMSVPTEVINGFDISKVMSMPGVKHLTRRKLENVYLHTLLGCMARPGLYISLYASLHAKVFYKLMYPDHEEEALDSKRAQKGKSNFDLMIGFIRAASTYRRRLEHYTELKESLISSLGERSSFGSMDTDEWEEQIPEDLKSEMSREEILEYISEMKERAQEEDEEEDNSEIMSQIEMCDRMIKKSKKPKEEFTVSQRLKERTTKIMTRLQHFEDITTHMNLKRVDMVGDLLTDLEVPAGAGLMELAKSPLDVIKRIPFETIKSRNLERKKEREEGRPMRPEEIFENCCYNPLTAEEVELAATVLGVLVYFHEEGRVVKRLSMRKCWGGMSNDGRNLSLVLLEELSAVIDSRVFHQCPSVTNKPKSRGLEVWELSIEEAYNKIKRISAKSGMRYRPHFRVVELVLNNLKANHQATSSKTSKDIPKMSSVLGTRALNKFNQRVEKLKGEGVTQDVRAEYALFGSQTEGVTTTEASGSEWEAPASVTRPEMFPGTPSTSMHDAGSGSAKSDEDIVDIDLDFSSDEEQDEPSEVSDIVYDF